MTSQLAALEVLNRAADVPVRTDFDAIPERVSVPVPPSDDDECCEGDECDDDDDIDRPVAVDPNDIFGPQGYGDEHWIEADRQLGYTIRYENDPAFATAPAQKVTITQQLDSNLDFRTFRLGTFGFGGLVFEVPENRASYSTRIDLVQERGYYVDVTAGIDVFTGQAFWTLVTIDP